MEGSGYGQYPGTKDQSRQGNTYYANHLSNDHRYPGNHMNHSDRQYPGFSEQSYSGNNDRSFPSNSDRSYLSNRDQSYPGNSNKSYPSNSDRSYHGSSDRSYLSNRDQSYPGNRDRSFPSTSDRSYPSVSEQSYPGMSDRLYPSVSDRSYPSVSDISDIADRGTHSTRPHPPSQYSGHHPHQLMRGGNSNDHLYHGREPDYNADRKTAFTRLDPSFYGDPSRAYRDPSTLPVAGRRPVQTITDPNSAKV